MRQSAQISTHYFTDDGMIPNNRDLPAVVMSQAFDPRGGAAQVRRMLEGNGWTGTWTWTVFDFHHYHPDAHEALAVASGEAEILLGGPSGRLFPVKAGDCLVLPAGTGHCRLTSSGGFQVCGGYPRGQETYTTLRDRADDRGDVLGEIRAVPLPQSDPIFGPDGPLVDLWHT